MADQNRLNKFWHELKRRKVVRVTIIYATVAFILLQLIDILVDPLHLPEWVMTFFVVLLLVGFPIVVILAWIFDITPEGIEVTPPANQKVEVPPVPKTRRKEIILDTIIGVLLVVVIILAWPKIFNNNSGNNLEKSIAVLPFIDDSPEQGNDYIINGLMDEILNKLQKIKDLNVKSRTAVEAYRNQKKSIQEISKELNANYILEGSGLKIGNKIKITLQLIEGESGNHLWSNPYFGEVDKNDLDGIFDLIENVSYSVAEELRAVITPIEKQRIEKKPTSNQTAYDFYQMGRDEYMKYQANIYDTTLLDKAEDLYNKALKYDTTYALAYIGLAQVYWDKHAVEERLTEDYMDSVLILANKALSYDKDLAEAYLVRGRYYNANGYTEKALNEFKKAVGINPNLWEAYRSMAFIYAYTDPLEALKNGQKAISLYPGNELPGFFLSMSASYFAVTGFPEVAKNIFEELLTINNDSSAYYGGLSTIELCNWNLELTIKYLKIVLQADSTRLDVLYNLAQYNIFLGNNKEAMVYIDKWLGLLDKTLVQSFRINGMYRVGYIYWKNGRFDEANHYFDLQLKKSTAVINSGYNPLFLAPHYDRAGVYAFRGEKEKAFEDLRIFNQRKLIPAYIIKLLKYDPMFDSIRDEPEFQQIIHDSEAKLQAEHDKIKKWLEEQGEI